MKRMMATLGRIKQLQRVAAERKARRRTERFRQLDAPTILDFVPLLSPSLRSPYHFGLFASRIEATRKGPVRCAFAAPPQHGKSMVTLHGLVWLIRQDPTKRHAYITYNLSRAKKVCRLFRQLLTAAGIKWYGTLDCVELQGGGHVIFTSIDKGLTGEPVDGVAIVDDPYSGPKDAESKARREFIEECYRQVIVTRVHPNASILILNTRWHPQDLTAARVAEGMEYINLPAIAEENDANGREVGEALFPEERPLDWLLRQQIEVGPYAWAALYQGRPRPKGGKVFHEPTFYTELPKVYRGAYGVDPAYTADKLADWSICLELWREEGQELPDGGRGKPKFYVVHVDRMQAELPAFLALLKLRHAARKLWKLLWRGSGTEKGSAALIRAQGVPLIFRQPPGDKFVSAQEVAMAWNDGRVLVPDTEKFPEAMKWLVPFLGVIGDFTGSGKGNETDDDADALGNAYELLKNGPPPANDNGGEERPKKKPAEGRKLAGF